MCMYSRKIDQNTLHRNLSSIHRGTRSEFIRPEKANKSTYKGTEEFIMLARRTQALVKVLEELK